MLRVPVGTMIFEQRKGEERQAAREGAAESEGEREREGDEAPLADLSEPGSRGSAGAARTP